MQFRKPVTASACLFGVGLLAAACSSSSSASSTASPATSSASSQAASQASSQATSQGSAAMSASATAPARAAGTAPTCTVSVLTVTLGAKAAGQGDQTQTVVLTNKGASACTMDGFPGVDLVGTASGEQNYSWPLTRSSASYSKVTLKPGGSAHFEVAYLPFAAGDGTEIAVSKIVLTPPGTTSQATLAWSQPVLLQDAATHPGTWITPVTAGA